jgi:hypothetical protein
MIDMMEAVVAASRRRFNPLSLSPALWLDASDANTLFDATSGGSLVAADGTVARWEDKSGNNRHFTQLFSSAMPIRKTDVQNGLDGARFDGSNDIMTMASGLDILRNAPGASWMAVVKWASNPTSNKVFAHVSTSEAQNFVLSAIGAGQTSQRSRQGVRRLASDSLYTLTGSTVISTDAYIQTAATDYIAQTIETRINNATDASATGILSSGNTSDSNSAAASIGGTPNAVSFSNIDLFEIFCFSRAISDSERNALHNYLASKWGITLS